MTEDTLDLKHVLQVLDQFFDGGAEDIESLDGLRDRVRTVIQSGK